VNDNSSATVMLGLEGMAVLAVSEYDDELEYAIETTATIGWCPVCGAQARLHDRRPTWVRDLPAGIEAGDEHGQVAAAWVAGQELRAIYRATAVEQAAARLYDWTVMCIDSGVPELRRLARTITTWREEFLAHFTAGRISNGPTEPSIC
jgi:Transposase